MKNSRVTILCIALLIAMNAYSQEIDSLSVTTPESLISDKTEKTEMRC
jgi:hypothetical protein